MSTTMVDVVVVLLLMVAPPHPAVACRVLARACEITVRSFWARRPAAKRWGLRDSGRPRPERPAPDDYDADYDVAHFSSRIASPRTTWPPTRRRALNFTWPLEAM